MDFPDDAKRLQKGNWTVTDSWERPGFRVKLGVKEEDGRCNVALRISDPTRVSEP
jgi:hypothetical protein